MRRVNDSPCGLQAGVFSRDMGLVFKAFEEIETGGVMANDVPTFRTDQMPCGGVRDSGTGRECLRYSIEEMTERKLLMMKFALSAEPQSSSGCKKRNLEHGRQF